MMELPEDGDGDEHTWVAHLRPRIHVSIDADSALDAQMTALQQVAEQLGDALDDTEMLVHEIGTEDLEIDRQAMLRDAMSGDGPDSIADMVPPDDSELGDPLDDE